MDVVCAACGHRASVAEAEFARGPVEVSCAECGAAWLVTKKGHSIAPRRRVPRDEPLDLRALADSDADRLSDIADLAEQSEAGRVSRFEPEDLFDVPPSVRAIIRASLLPTPPRPAEHAAEPVEHASVAPPGRHRGRLAIGLLGVGIVAAVAIGHATMTTEADGVERIVATPFTPARRGPVSAQEIVGSVEPRAPPAPKSEKQSASEPARGASAAGQAHGGSDARRRSLPAKPDAPIAAEPEASPSPSVSASGASSAEANPDLMRAMQKAVDAHP